MHLHNYEYYSYVSVWCLITWNLCWPSHWYSHKYSFRCATLMWYCNIASNMTDDSLIPEHWLITGIYHSNFHHASCSRTYWGPFWSKKVTCICYWLVKHFSSNVHARSWQQQCTSFMLYQHLKQLPWSNNELDHKIHASVITLVSAQHIPVPPNCCPVQSFWQESGIVSEPLSVSSKSPCSLIWSSDCLSSPNTQKHKFKYHYHITQLYRRKSEEGNLEKIHPFSGPLQKGSRMVQVQEWSTYSRPCCTVPCYIVDLDIPHLWSCFMLYKCLLNILITALDCTATFNAIVWRYKA